MQRLNICSFSLSYAHHFPIHRWAMPIQRWSSPMRQIASHVVITVVGILPSRVLLSSLNVTPTYELFSKQKRCIFPYAVTEKLVIQAGDIVKIPEPWCFRTRPLSTYHLVSFLVGVASPIADRYVHDMHPFLKRSTKRPYKAHKMKFGVEKPVQERGLSQLVFEKPSAIIFPL